MDCTPATAIQTIELLDNLGSTQNQENQMVNFISQDDYREKRRIQNRIAQRNYRFNKKKKIQQLEQQVAIQADLIAKRSQNSLPVPENGFSCAPASTFDGTTISGSGHSQTPNETAKMQSTPMEEYISLFEPGTQPDLGDHTLSGIDQMFIDGCLQESAASYMNNEKNNETHTDVVNSLFSLPQHQSTDTSIAKPEVFMPGEGAHSYVTSTMKHPIQGLEGTCPDIPISPSDHGSIHRSSSHDDYEDYVNSVISDGGSSASPALSGERSATLKQRVHNLVRHANLLGFKSLEEAALLQTIGSLE